MSIATLAGPNGILTQANEAKIEQSHSAVKEGIILAYGEYQIETKTSSKNQQIQEMAKIASTEITKIPGKQERSLAGQIVTFFDFLQTKGYINAEGIINVKNLLRQTVALGNGTTTDIYKIEQQTDTYVLNYYGENNTPEKLWELKRDDVVDEEIENYEKYMLHGYISEMSSGIEIKLLGEKEEFLDKATDEEIFINMICKDEFNSFEEFIEAEYNAGYINKKYNNLKDYIMEIGKMSEDEYEIEINSMRTEWKSADIQLFDPDGNEIFNSSYEVPCKIGKYIFTAKISHTNGYEKEYKFKISIDKFEVIEGDHSDICVGDIENRKYLHINNGRTIQNGEEKQINLENILDEGEFSYIYNYKLDRIGIFKCIFQCPEGEVQGYLEYVMPN